MEEISADVSNGENQRGLERWTNLNESVSIESVSINRFLPGVGFALRRRN
jgi:hypothetical protein